MAGTDTGSFKERDDNMLETLLTAEQNFLLWIQDNIRNDVITGLTSLVGVQKDYSFPSGHTGSSFAAAVVMMRMLPKRYGIPAMVMAVLIGVSRMCAERIRIEDVADVMG